MPSAIVKADFRNLPFIGSLGDHTGCLYLDRADKNESKTVVEKTIKR